MNKCYAMEIYFALEGVNHGNRQANEKFALDNVDEIEETRKGTRKPGDRATRRKATAKAKRHLQEIYPFTDSVKETRNGGYIHTGNTFEWHPVWKKLDKRASRHAGKDICRGYEEEKYIVTEIVIPETDHSDVTTETDFAGYHEGLRGIKTLEYPCIMTATVSDMEIRYGVDVGFYVLGVVNNEEEATEIYKEFYQVNASFSGAYVEINGTPLTGSMESVGGAFYIE